MRHEYVKDLVRICFFLQTALIRCGATRFYDYIDIINEPGHPSIYKIRFYFKKAEKYGKLLCDLYKEAVFALEDKLSEEKLRYIVEPFNYDVS